MKNISRKIAVFVLVVMTAMVMLPFQATVGKATGDITTTGHVNIAGSKHYAQFIKMVLECIQTGLNPNQHVEIQDERTPLGGPELDSVNDAPQIVEEQAASAEEVQQADESVAYEATVQPEPASAIVETPAQPVEPEIVQEPEHDQTQEGSAEQTITLLPTVEHDVSGILYDEPISTTESSMDTQDAAESATDEAMQAEPTEPVIEHTVIYVDQDDLFLRTLLVEDGGTIQVPQSIPELEGHTFLYWYEIEVGQVPYEFGTPVNRNMILKPLFEEDETETLPEIPVENEPDIDAAEPDPVTVVEEPPKSEHEVIGVIKGDDGLEILIVKDPVETELTVTPDDEMSSQDPASTPEEEQSLEPTVTSDEPITEETEDSFTGEEDEVSTDPTTETESETSEEATSEETSTDEPTEDDGVSEEDPVTSDEGDEPTLEPTVELMFDYVTDDENGLLVEGSVITVTAVLSNYPEGVQLKYQWQNNADGEFADVPGATELSYSFVADQHNTGCSWRMVVSIVEPELSDTL